MRGWGICHHAACLSAASSCLLPLLLLLLLLLLHSVCSPNHVQQARATGHAFTGASLETYGIFGDDLRKLIKDFAKCGGDRRFSAGPNGWSAPNFIELSRQRIAVAAQIGLYNMMAKAQRARNGQRRGAAAALACLDPSFHDHSSLVSLHHVASRESSD